MTILSAPDVSSRRGLNRVVGDGLGLRIVRGELRAEALILPAARGARRVIEGRQATGRNT